MKGRKRLLAIALGATVLGFANLARAVYIRGKAALAQILLEKAWTESIREGKNKRPWSWADTWPVARLSIPRLGSESIVLHGGSGQSMAFGPGHLTASAPLGASGLSVIAAHRDTHFRALEDIRLGDDAFVEIQTGKVIHYRVRDIKVVSADHSGLTNDAASSNGSRLALVTCYPFLATARSSERYVVLLDAVDQHV